MIKVDVSRVADAAKRHEAKRLFDAHNAAQAALEECREPEQSEAVEARIEEARLAYRKRVEEIKAAASAEAGKGDIAALEAAAEAAEKAWDEFDCFELKTNNGEVQCCALSGLPLWEDEAVLTDDNTGEVVLKELLGDLDEDDGAFVAPEPEQKAA
jgi:hypothetical protein